MILGVVGFCLLQGLVLLMIDQLWPDSADPQNDDIYGGGGVGGVGGILSLLSESFYKFVWVRSDFKEQDQRPLLIIGGSDGSGTRAFVDIIRELGVVIVADDAQSFDVHAAQMFGHQGWPGLVNAVLNVTHTANYEFPNDIEALTSPEYATNIQTQVQYLYRSLKSKYDVTKRFQRRMYLKQNQREQKQSRRQQQQQQQRRRRLVSSPSSSFSTAVRRRRKPPHPGSNLVVGGGPLASKPTMFAARAEAVSFAIKAPVSMLVLPVLTKVWGAAYQTPIKFLHVIRE
jgi:hypothetical protein